MDASEAEGRFQTEALLKEHLTMLRAYLQHLLSSPHDADDVFQDVCVAALKDPQLLLRGADVGAYLRGVARHLASRHQRNCRRAENLENLIETVWAVHEDPKVDSERERRALRECLAELPDKFRVLLTWRYENALDSKAMAARLNQTREAVRMALVRTRQTLGRCMRRRLTQLPEGAE
jgi:RNA polymerase sigma-70 factor, ECF subfamily